jgi:hypothetical protein
MVDGLTVGSTRDMPAAGFVRQGAGAVRGWLCADLATSRAAVVGGFAAGGLRRAARAGIADL